MSINLSFRQLEAFIAVVESLSFSEASGRVHMSQPALSAAIKKLEDSIGARLFDRDTRNVSLTPIGEELFGEAEGLVHRRDEALRHVRQFLLGKRGRIVMAVAPSVAGGFLPGVITAFLAEHPDVSFEMHDSLSEVSIGLVRAGKVDFALTAGRRIDPTLVHQDLLTDRMVLLCRSSDALAKFTAVSWDQVIPRPQVAFTRTSNARHFVEAVYRRKNLTYQPMFEVDNVVTVAGLVGDGLGVAVVPYLMIRHANFQNVAWIPIRGSQARRSICIVTQKVRSLSPTAEAFLRLCKKEAARIEPNTRTTARSAKSGGSFRNRGT